MKNIIVKSTDWDYRTGYQLSIIRNFLRENSAGKNYLDFSNFKFCPPLLSTYFSCLVDNNPGFGHYSKPHYSYCQTINFLQGYSPSSADDWQRYLNGFSSKSYLPLIKFSTGKSEVETITRDNLISHVCQMIRQIAKLPMNYYIAINYLLSELTDNIVDHSGHDFGWISFQYYPSKGFLDISLADSGIGVLNSYLAYSGEKDYSHVATHLDAIETMIRGGSTKSLKERGFGVHTSREMLVDGLNGTFVFLSGNGLLINYRLVDFGVASQGALAFLRVPVVNLNETFNIYEYTE
ncbi:ATP-binding protein [Litoribacter ruber]|uniref:ATP-binding protein n=1 Tax=Litoribacter ruber TaxID=702568 RepID=UPI001BD93E14|nr:ATP-binding protein [Litoribacter ruber]MBT0813100.1 ATP-binding protein [Litoribacter ruber]